MEYTELSNILKLLRAGSYEKKWQMLSDIAKYEPTKIDFEDNSVYITRSRQVLNALQLFLSEEFPHQHPYINTIKKKITIWNALVNPAVREGNGVAQLNIHDSRLSPIRKKGKEYLNTFASEMDNELKDTNWLDYYRNYLDEIIKIKLELKDYMDFLFEEEKNAWQSNDPHHLCITEAITKAWYLSKNEHGDEHLKIDSDFIIPPLMDSSKAYEKGSGFFHPDLPYSCHTGASERVEERIGLFADINTKEDESQLTNLERYSKDLSTYVSLYFQLLGQSCTKFPNEKYDTYTFNSFIIKYVNEKAVFYLQQYGDIADEDEEEKRNKIISENILRDLFELHKPVSEGFLFRFMFGEDKDKAKIKILNDINNVVFSAEYSDAAKLEKASLKEVLRKDEETIKSNIKSVQEAYRKVVKSRKSLTYDERSPIFTTTDEVAIHFEEDASLASKATYFECMNLDIYKQYIARYSTDPSLTFPIENYPLIISNIELFGHYLDTVDERELNRKFTYEEDRPLHIAMKAHPNKAFLIFSQSQLSKEKKLELLMVRNFRGRSPLHYAGAEALSALLDSEDMTIEEKIQLLSCKDCYGIAALRSMISYCPTPLSIFLKSKINIKKKLELLKENDIYGETALFSAIKNGHSDVLLELFKSDLPMVDKLELLMTKNIYDDTVLHTTSIYAMATLTTFLAVDLDGETKNKLLGDFEERNHSLLHAAVMENPSKMLRELFNSNIQLEDKIKLLKAKAKKPAFRILDYIFGLRDMTGVKTFLELDFPYHQKIQLLSEPDSSGLSIMDRFCYNKNKLDLFIEAANDGHLELKYFNTPKYHFHLACSGQIFFQIRIILDVLMRAGKWCCSLPKMSNYFRNSAEQSTDIATHNTIGLSQPDACQNDTQSSNTPRN